MFVLLGTTLAGVAGRVAWVWTGPPGLEVKPGAYVSDVHLRTSPVH